MKTPKTISKDAPIYSFMRAMGPKCPPDEDLAPDELPLNGALMCSIMILNSVIERQGNRILEAHQMTLPQWLALGCVANGGEDGVPHSQIGHQLMLSKAPVTGVVDRLARAAFVERRPDAKDRRVMRVVITPRGLDEWFAVKQSLRGFSEGLIGENFSDDEQEQLVGLLGRMLEAFAQRDPHLNGGRVGD